MYLNTYFKKWVLHSRWS